MFDFLLSQNYIRQRLLKKTTSPVMKKYLSTPFPGKNELVCNTKIISLDMETTGLNCQSDQVISMGTVKIFNLGINLGTCWHQLIQLEQNLPEESVVVHKITDDQLVNGANIEQALAVLLEQLQGSVLLVHNKKVEQSFLNFLCQKFYQTDFIIPIIDTQYLAKRRFERQGISFKSNELRLFNLRKRYHMPAYTAHNALLDAISTAELFVAMLADMNPRNTARLKDVLS